MNKLWLQRLVASCVLCAGIMFAQEGNVVEDLVKAEPHPETVAGELLVKYKDGIGIQDVNAEVAALGVTSVQEFRPLNLVKCTIANPDDLPKALALMKNDNNIDYAEPNYVLSILETVPNDSRYSSQYALNNTGQTGGVRGADISAQDVWDLQTGSRDIIVGVIDTGVDDGHNDLAANMWRNPGESGDGKESNGVDDDGNGYVDDYRGWDFINNDNNPYDDNDHGTHCAGIIGAVGNNGSGISGINWNVSLVGLKFLSGAGSGSTDDAVEAILYAIDLGIPILSNSWGGGGRSQALEDAIEAANQAGILFVAAAGNDSKNTDNSDNFPSNYGSANVVSVASSDDRDQLSSFSNYGKETVDLAAPGSSILSTVANNNYQSLSGTSMATPYVAGVAALIMAQYPGISMEEVKYRLMGSVDFKSAFANRTVSGGRLNAVKALSDSPVITVVAHPNTSSTTPYNITAQIVDDGSIASATLNYEISGNGSGTGTVPLTANGVNFTGQVPGQALESTVTYSVTATDDAGNSTTSRSVSFNVTANPDPGCCGAAAFTVNTGNTHSDALLTILLNLGFAVVALLYLRKRLRK